MTSTGRSSPNHATLLRLLGEKDLAIAELEDENRSLQSQLQTLRVNAVSTARQSGHVATILRSGQEDAASRSLSVDSDYGALSSKYDTLVKQHKDLQSKYARCVARTKQAMEYYEKAKQNARQWKAYLAHKAARKPLGNSASIGVQTADVLADTEHELTPRPLRPAGLASKANTRQALGEPKDAPMIAAGLAPAENRENSHRGSQTPSPHAVRVSSSQTTQAESDSTDQVASSLPRQQSSNGGEPIVVSTRSLKRKRGIVTKGMPPPTRIKQEPQSPKRVFEVRSEDYSSPVNDRHPITRTETSDLDTLSANLRVARRYRAREMSERAVSEEILRPPPSLSSRVSSLSETDLPSPTDLPVPPKIKREAGDPTSAAHRNSNTNKGSIQPLQGLSVNLPSKTSARSSAAVKSLLQKRRPERAMVAALSEDGENMGSQTLASQEPKVDVNPKADGRRRLDTMLEAPSSGKTPLIKNQGAEPDPGKNARARPPILPDGHQAKTRSSNPPLLQTSERRLQPPTLKESYAKRASPRKRGVPIPGQPLGIEESRPPVNLENKPLRSRPLPALYLNDFKINSKFMGTDFAYSETLRGRDQRRCMIGCTKPECCGGAFRKAVEMAGTAGSTKTDAEVLEAYLGSNWEQLMGAYAPDKRKDLLMQAHASSMANQFGKHRQNFERRSTPPGFWRTDMPSTQEAEEDRAKALAMERQKIEERWREAMREGGRWRFRDE